MPEDLLDADADDLRALRAYGERLGIDHPGWERPPADLWDRISAEAGVGTGPTASPAPSVPAAPSAPAAPADGAEVLPFHRPRRRGPGHTPPWLLAVAAVAAVVLLVAGGLLVVRSGDDDAPAVVASTSLDRLGAAGSGDAELIEADGELRLRVDTADLDPGDGFLEVWVIDPEVTKLVSLGPLRPDGTYDLPAGLDPEDFPVVDVSVEPLDGNPAHSGDSVLRGTLTF